MIVLTLILAILLDPLYWIACLLVFSIAWFVTCRPSVNLRALAICCTITGAVLSLGFTTYMHSPPNPDHMPYPEESRHDVSFDAWDFLVEHKREADYEAFVRVQNRSEAMRVLSWLERHESDCFTMISRSPFHRIQYSTFVQTDGTVVREPFVLGTTVLGACWTISAVARLLATFLIFATFTVVFLRLSKRQKVAS